MLSKKCCRCNIDKPSEDFSLRSGDQSGIRGTCKPCVRIQRNLRYARNAEKAANYYVANKKRIVAYRIENKKNLAKSAALFNAKNPRRTTAWAKANPDRVQAAKSRYRKKADSKLKGAEHKRQWYAANPAKVKAMSKRAAEKRKANGKAREERRIWRKKNAEAIRVRNRNRKALQRNAPGTHTKADIEFLYKTQKGSCVACRIGLEQGYHVDHIVALINCGTNDRRNLQLLCPPCNLSKNSKDPIEFMQSKGFLC